MRRLVESTLEVRGAFTVYIPRPGESSGPFGSGSASSRGSVDAGAEARIARRQKLHLG